MNRLLLLLSFGMVSLHSYGQEENGRSLHYYIETAKENSPLITDYRNQRAIEQTELERLKAMYTHSRLELNGDYLFVPIMADERLSNGMRVLPQIITGMIWVKVVVPFMPERLGHNLF